MVTVAAFLKRVESVNVGEESQLSIQDTREQLVLKQQMQQLHGLDAGGNKIGEYRSPVYAEAKHRINPLAGFGNVDLRLTGEFHGDMFIDVRPDTFVIESGNEKTDALVKKYGEDIFGLSKDYNTQYVQENLKPVFIGNIREKLKL